MDDSVQPRSDRRLGKAPPLPPPPHPGSSPTPAMQRHASPCSHLNASNDNRRRCDGREPRVDEILRRLLAARRLDVLRVLGQVGAVRVKRADRVRPDVEAAGRRQRHETDRSGEVDTKPEVACSDWSAAPLTPVAASSLRPPSCSFPRTRSNPCSSAADFFSPPPPGHPAPTTCADSTCRG